MKKCFTNIILIAALGLFVSACAAYPETPSQSPDPALQQEGESEGSGVPVSMMADSLDTAILRRIDTETGQLLCYSLQADKSYVLTYDSATTIRDSFDQELVAGQLHEGDVAAVAFQMDTHLARGIYLDDQFARSDGVDKFEIHDASHTMEIGEQQYSLDKNCLVLSGGRLLDFSDINDSDTLSVIAEDKNILALVITKGHGYVRLLGADAFEGGFVEFGQDLIRQVEKDALYVVPEGSYQMLISKGTDCGMKEITVTFGKETEVDVSDIVTDADRTGKIVFTIKPPGAKLSIDGEDTSYSNEVELFYGIHQVEVSCEGYQTLTQYIRVGEPMANLSIELKEAAEKSDTQDSGETDQKSESVSANSVVTPAAEGEYRVYIDAPTGAELYVDDAYVGVVPCHFIKKSGKHTVSLRREGYITRSYTLDVDDGENDNHYSFSSLKPNTTTDTGDLVQSALSSLLSGDL